MKKSSRLDLLRKKIITIDEQLMILLSERLEVADQVGEYKRIHELPVEDPHIEMRKRRDRAAFLHKLTKTHTRDVETIFRSIIQVSRDVQRRRALAVEMDYKKNEKLLAPIRIAVMGSQGSFSEEAALKYCVLHKIKHCSLLYPVSAEGVLHLLEVEKADVGIFPIHNSTGGIVEESIYAASEHNFFIDDLFGVEVSQCLMALPNVKMKDIKTIMSHPQALAQCKGYLKSFFPNAELIEGSDTATSAKYLGENSRQKTMAVIAPVGCAKLYNLNLLEEGIQDQKNNITHFIAAMM